MKNFLKGAKLALILGGAAIFSTTVTPAHAAPLSTSDYLIFEVKERASNKQKFREVIKLVFGDPQNFVKYFGEAGPNPFQKAVLKSSKGTIIINSTGNDKVLAVEFEPGARKGQNYLAALIDGAQCQAPGAEPEPCQVDLRVVKTRKQSAAINSRIIATGSNGVVVDSGKKDVRGTYTFVGSED